MRVDQLTARRQPPTAGEGLAGSASRRGPVSPAARQHHHLRLDVSSVNCQAR